MNLLCLQCCFFLGMMMGVVDGQPPVVQKNDAVVGNWKNIVEGGAIAFAKGLVVVPGALVLAGVGYGVTAITRQFNDKIDAKFDVVEAKFDAVITKIDAVNTKIDTKFDAVKELMIEKFALQDGQIANGLREARLEKHLRDLHSKSATSKNATEN